MNGYMWPINGLAKGKRIAWGPQQNHLSWAYMKMLRESNRNMRVYNVNPYIEVYRFEENLYGLFNQNVDGMGDVWQYLIIGPQKAMLIDTAYGIGDMKGLCDELTGGKELIVANTHIGPDHALGNVRFDRVYCHEYEYDKILARVTPDAWKRCFNPDGSWRALEIDKKAIPTYRPFELIPLKNHHIFNLGGDCDVELIWMPGHAQGHAMYLDKKHRWLFCGDDVCSDVINCGSGDGGSPYCTVEAYHRELVKLCGRLDEFDYMFPGHFMVYLENGLLNNIREALEEVLADPANCTYKEEGLDRHGRYKVTYYKRIQQFSVLTYNPTTGVYMESTKP